MCSEVTALELQGCYGRGCRIGPEMIGGGGANDFIVRCDCNESSRRRSAEPEFGERECELHAGGTAIPHTGARVACMRGSLAVRPMRAVLHRLLHITVVHWAAMHCGSRFGNQHNEPAAQQSCNKA